MWLRISGGRVSYSINVVHCPRGDRGGSPLVTIRLVLAVLFAGALLALTWGATNGQSLDPTSQEGLAAVLRMLQDPALRNGAVAESPQAGAADAQIRSLTGGSAALTQEFYDLAGRIFEEVTRASGGDVLAMTQILARAQADPASFAAMLSPETLDRLHALAAKLSDQSRRQ